MTATAIAPAATRLEAALGERYAVQRELGGGGMSHVYLAEERALGRRVAIKVLPAELLGAVSAARFRREILLAAQLQHPHIVPVLAAGEVEGTPYFVMPYVEGESLRARLVRQGALPVAEAVRVLRDVAAALAYAHGRGVVHRDVKPDNVLVSGGIATVTDFGVAKALGVAGREPRAPRDVLGEPAPAAVAPAAPTAAGFVIGTPAYMAPEQAAGDPATDHRADIYAFGVLAYELLVGEAPFAGRATGALLAAHAVEPVPRVDALRPRVPAALADLVEQCVEKHPVDRPQTALALLRALDAPGVGRPGAGRGPRALATRLGVPTRWIAAAVVLLAATGGTAAWHRGVRAPRAAAVPVLFSGVTVAGPDSVMPAIFTELVRVRLARTPALRLAGRAERPAAGGAGGPAARGRAAGAALAPEAARAAALRLGAQAVIQGHVTRRVGGYAFSLTALDPESGDVVVALRETASGPTPAMAAMERLGERFEPALAAALSAPAPAPR